MFKLDTNQNQEIHQDPIDMVNFYHRKFNGLYSPLVIDNSLYLVETFELLNKDINPYDNNVLGSAEKNLINFNAKCFTTTGNMDMNQNMIMSRNPLIANTRSVVQIEKIQDDNKLMFLKNNYKLYIKNRVDGKSYDYLLNKDPYLVNLVKCYMTITDFQDHFKYYDHNNDQNMKYERTMATQALTNSRRGSWLLRHSSLNRITSEQTPLDEEEIDRRYRLGIKYYALSYLDYNRNIRHGLLRYEASKGWRVGNETDEGTWFTNFLEALETFLQRHNLDFSSRIGDYILVTN